MFLMFSASLFLLVGLHWLQTALLSVMGKVWFHCFPTLHTKPSRYLPTLFFSASYLCVAGVECAWWNCPTAMLSRLLCSPASWLWFWNWRKSWRISASQSRSSMEIGKFADGPSSLPNVPRVGFQIEGSYSLRSLADLALVFELEQQPTLEVKWTSKQSLQFQSRPMRTQSKRTRHCRIRSIIFHRTPDDTFYYIHSFQLETTCSCLV